MSPVRPHPAPRSSQRTATKQRIARRETAVVRDAPLLIVPKTGVIEIWLPHDAHDAAAAMLSFLKDRTETKS